MSELVWVPVTILHETEQAVLVTTDPNPQLGITDVDQIVEIDSEWIPKSQISDSTDDMDIGAEVEIEIPEWLATEKGLV